MKIAKYISKDSESIVELNDQKGEITIKGRFISIEPSEIWSKTNNWIANYKARTAKKTIINLQFEYINTGNVIALFSWINAIGKLSENNNNIQINWQFEDGDDDMKELGEDINAVSKFPISFESLECVNFSPNYCYA